MSHEVWSATWGAVIAIVNICIAVIAFRISLRQAEMTMFLRIIFGSMAARSILSLAAVWYGLKIRHLSVLPFVLTLLTFYVVSLGAEVVALHRKQLALTRAKSTKISA